MGNRDHSSEAPDPLGEFLTQYNEYLDGNRSYTDLPSWVPDRKASIMRKGRRTCPGCGYFEMLCERCGRCDGLDLPRAADRAPPCCPENDLCIERDWRDAITCEGPKHITEQMWTPEQREDGVYLIGEDGSVVLKLCRSDRVSDLTIAGYVMGLQGKQLSRKGPP